MAASRILGPGERLPDVRAILTDESRAASTSLGAYEKTGGAVAEAGA